MRAVVIGTAIGRLATAPSLHSTGLDVNMAEAVGDEQLLRAFTNLVPHSAQERAPAGFVDVADVTGRAELEASGDRDKKIAGFDREALDPRPSAAQT